MVIVTRLAGRFLAGNPAFTPGVVYPRGKRREIDIPNKPLRDLHAATIRQLRNSRSVDKLDKHAYGGLRGGSTIANALVHRKNRYVYQLDITSAYTATPLMRLARELARFDASLGSWQEIEQFLERFCKGGRGGLATGGPVSPALFDIYCGMTIDRHIRSRFPGLTYSRYLDDLTISQAQPIPTVLRRYIRGIVEDAGFVVSRHKSKVIDRRRVQTTITGVVITPEGLVRPTDAFLAKHAVLLETSPQATTKKQREVVAGGLAYLSSFVRFCPKDCLDPQVKMLWQRTRDRLRADARPSVVVAGAYTRRRLPTGLVERVRNTAPIKDVIGGHIKLRRKGSEYVGKCPAHNERRPSFSVSPQKHIYYCFGCGIHGDAVDFLMKFGQMDFRAAVLHLQDRFSL